MKKLIRGPLYEVRHSPIHGYGVFALRKIRKGTRVIEYTGERISHDAADTRYEDKDPNDNHTFLFTVDKRMVIDGGVKGNEARFINHGCDPNCESATVKRRVYIGAIKTILPGEELAYDYSIQRDNDDEPDVDEVFACRCGAVGCRGSMLEPPKNPKRRAVKTADRAAGKHPPSTARKTSRKTARKASRKPSTDTDRHAKSRQRPARR